MFQQLADDFFIISTSFISLYDLTDRIGNKIIYAPTLRRGSLLQLDGYGQLTTSSAGQFLYMEIIYGSTTITSQVFTLPVLTGGSDYEYHIESVFYETGNPGLVKTHGKFDFIDAQGNAQNKYFDS